MICAICSKEFNNNTDFSVHIRYFHKMKSKDYYDTYLKKPTDGICATCGKPTKFNRLSTGGYLKFCSVTCAQINEDTRLKYENTCLERYNATNVYASEYGKQKIIQTNLDRYNVTHLMKLKEVAEDRKVKSSRTKRNKKNKYICENNVVTKEYLTERFGWNWYWDRVIMPIEKTENGFWVNYYKKEDIIKIEKYIEETIHKNRSHKEVELLKYVQSIYDGPIKHDCKSIISPKEIDIYLPELKIGIEYNGTRWHSIEMGTPIEYHLNKSILCREKGIRLIHIYEFEDIEVQKQLLKDLINGIDNYPKDDFNKNNFLEFIPEAEVIYDAEYTVYGAGELK